MSVAVHIEETSSTLTGDRLKCEELEELCAEAKPIVLVGERLLTAQAMRLLMRIDRDLREARCQMNQDWFRRLMRVRGRAVSREFGEERSHDFADAGKRFTQLQRCNWAAFGGDITLKSRDIFMSPRLL